MIVFFFGLQPALGSAQRPGWSLGQIHQYDIGIIPQTVEYNLLIIN
jgi:hypothetical protein